MTKGGGESGTHGPCHPTTIPEQHSQSPFPEAAREHMFFLSGYGMLTKTGHTQWHKIDLDTLPGGKQNYSMGQESSSDSAADGRCTAEHM